MTGNELRAIRRKLGLSQTEFGELIGAHFVTVSRWETGQLPIRSTVAKLAKLLAANRGSKPRPVARRR